jgi:hypothetical protein
VKVVFCDIDGVLNNPACHSLRSNGCIPADPKCIAALNRILQATGARIVLSSAWRLDGFDFCHDRFAAWGVAAPIFDFTPELTHYGQLGPDGVIFVAPTRGEEIDSWLRGRPQGVESFVILDDTNRMAPHMARLVLVDENAGLTEADADRAIAILGRELLS